MKHLTITIEDEVYLKTLELSKRRELSSTVNAFLKNYLDANNNEIRKEENKLLKDKEKLSKKLNEINSKLTYIELEKEKESEDNEKIGSAMVESIKRSGKLKDLI